MVATGWLREFRSTITSLVGGSSSVNSASGLLATLNSIPNCLAVSATFNWKNRSSIKAATRPMRISPFLQQPFLGLSPAAFEVLQSACPPEDLDASSFASFFFVAATRFSAGKDPGHPGDASARRSRGYPRLEARGGSLVDYRSFGAPAGDRAVVRRSRQANRCRQQSHAGKVLRTRRSPTAKKNYEPVSKRVCDAAPGALFLLAWHTFFRGLPHRRSSGDGSNHSFAITQRTC